VVEQSQAFGAVVIAVDANILVYSLITFPKTHLAKDLRLKDPDWRFPPLWKYEFGNALTTMVRQNEISAQAAHEGFTEAQYLFAAGEMPVDDDLALQVALKRKLTFYDAQYLALAYTLNVPLLTEDKALRKAANGKAMSLEEFLN